MFTWKNRAAPCKLLWLLGQWNPQQPNMVYKGHTTPFQHLSVRQQLLILLVIYFSFALIKSTDMAVSTVVVSGYKSKYRFVII